jgi:hypothetical protein
VSLERGPLSLVRITEELLELKSSVSGSRNPRITAVGIRCADHATPSISKMFTLTSPTSGGRSDGIVRLRTEATEFESLFHTRIFMDYNCIAPVMQLCSILIRFSVAYSPIMGFTPKGME